MNNMDWQELSGKFEELYLSHDCHQSEEDGCDACDEYFSFKEALKDEFDTLKFWNKRLLTYK